MYTESLPQSGTLAEWWFNDMHYPHRISKMKRKRRFGFRARMRTSAGRKLINRKRRMGRSVNVR